MQRIQLIELEMDTRPNINADELSEWMEEAERKFDAEEFEEGLGKKLQEQQAKEKVDVKDEVEVK